MMTAIVWPFVIYWLVCFAACLTVVELMQDQLYDEVTPNSGLKVAGGSIIFAVLATWLRPSFDTMFTADISWTLLQAIVWFGVFTLIFQFHPWHALGLSLVTLILVPGLATLGVDSLTKPATTSAPVRAQGAPPVRGSFQPAVPAKKAEPAPK